MISLKCDLLRYRPKIDNGWEANGRSGGDREGLLTTFHLIITH